MEPLPQTPYSKAQIDDYLRIHLMNHVGKAWRHEHYQERVARWIEALPNWAQIVLMEEGVTFELGDRKHTGLPAESFATADPQALHIKVGAYQSTALEISLGHEVGHLFDRILYQLISQDPDDQLDYSEDSPEWAQALKRETARPRQERTKINRDFRKDLFNPAYEIIDREPEALGIMFEHYFNHHRYHHSEAKTAQFMAKNFPVLWPTFEAEVTAPLKEYAVDLWELRQQLRQQDAPTALVSASR